MGAVTERVPLRVVAGSPQACRRTARPYSLLYTTPGGRRSPTDPLLLSFYTFIPASLVTGTTDPDSQILDMVETNSTLCPSDNQIVIDQSSFWDSNGLNWDSHRIGWVIAGTCAAVVRSPFRMSRAGLTWLYAIDRHFDYYQCLISLQVSTLWRFDSAP